MISVHPLTPFSLAHEYNIYLRHTGKLKRHQYFIEFLNLRFGTDAHTHSKERGYNGVSLNG